MDEILTDFFESNFNYKKLKRSRKKRKLSLNDAAEMANIPPATLQRYEDGITKKIPLEAVKKLCSIYGTDYNAYYTWTSFPLFGSLSGLLISLFYGISIPVAYTGTVLGSVLGVLGMLSGKQMFEKASMKKEKVKEVIYESLSNEEKIEYDDFFLISKTLLKTDNTLDENEKEEMDNLLFATFMMHQIRRKNKKKIIDFENTEILKEINTDNN